jgi:hypothetical protein
MRQIMNTSVLCWIATTLVLATGVFSHAAEQDKSKAALRALYDQVRPFVSLSEVERAALAKRGPVAVYFPIGSNDRGLVSEIKQMKLDSLSVFVNDATIKGGALAGKPASILPACASLSRSRNATARSRTTSKRAGAFSPSEAVFDISMVWVCLKPS